MAIDSKVSRLEAFAAKRVEEELGRRSTMEDCGEGEGGLAGGLDGWMGCGDL